MLSKKEFKRLKELEAKSEALTDDEKVELANLKKKQDETPKATNRWQAADNFIKTGERQFAFTSEHSSAAVIKGGMIVLLDANATEAAKLWGVTSGVLKDTIDSVVAKYLAAQNYQVTLTSTAVSNYLVAAAEMYANYIMLKKYYNCRQVEIIDSSNFRFSQAYLYGAVQDDLVGARTTHAIAQDRYIAIGDYIADKDWQTIDTFVAGLVLPTSIKKYIEDTYGVFFGYDKQNNTIISIDPTYGYLTPKTGENYDTTGKNINYMLQNCISRITTIEASVTASITGFLIECGAKQVAIPEKFKQRRSKTGTESMEVQHINDVMRAAINNCIGICMSSNTAGYKWNATQDSIVLNSDKHFNMLPSNNKRLSAFDLTTKQSNYASELAFLTFTAKPYCISLWALNNVGQPFNCQWGSKLYRFELIAAAPMGGYPNAVISAALTTLSNYCGAYNTPDYFGALQLDTRRDNEVQVYMYEDPDTKYGAITVNFVPRPALYQEEADIKIYDYTYLKSTALQTLAMNAAAEKDLDKFIDKLRRSINTEKH